MLYERKHSLGGNGHTPTRLTFDRLFTFGVTRAGAIDAVAIKHVGWDKDERAHRFVRVMKSWR